MNIGVVAHAFKIMWILALILAGIVIAHLWPELPKLKALMQREVNAFLDEEKNRPSDVYTTKEPDPILRDPAVHAGR